MGAYKNDLTTRINIKPEDVIKSLRKKNNELLEEVNELKKEIERLNAIKM